LHIRRIAPIRSALVSLIAVALAGAVGAGCGGDDDGDEPAPESLATQIPPPSQLGPLREERSFTWDNATDFVVQGTVLPQATAPSSAIAEIDDAGFAAGAGQILIPKGPGGGAPVNVSVGAFDSSDGATQAQDYLHEQDLQQPCFAACAVNPEELTIEEIPGATAVHQVPTKGELPPGLERFEGFAVEFTIGSNLFYAYASGSPGDIPVADFVRGARSFYEHASQRSE
jgi:hypothetical protein